MLHLSAWSEVAGQVRLSKMLRTVTSWYANFVEFLLRLTRFKVKSCLLSPFLTQIWASIHSHKMKLFLSSVIILCRYKMFLLILLSHTGGRSLEETVPCSWRLYSHNNAAVIWTYITSFEMLEHHLQPLDHMIATFVKIWMFYIASETPKLCTWWHYYMS